MKTFNSFSAFSKYILKASIVMQESLDLELKALGKEIAKEAKDEIGKYQDAIGDFPAWQELADSTKKDRVRHGYTENDPLLRSGKLRRSISSKASHLSVVIGSTSDIAVWQELGTSHIPPRPFLGTAAYKKKKLIVDRIGLTAYESIAFGKRISIRGYEGHYDE